MSVAAAAPAQTSINATEGAVFNGQVGTLTPAPACSPATNPSGTITWGDSTTSAATYQPLPGTSQYTISGSHTYGEEGDRTGSVASQYSCPSGGMLTATSLFTAHVADASLNATPANISVTAGRPFTAPVASFSDADPARSLNDYAAQIDWGDGSHSSGSVTSSGGGYSVQGSHGYAAAGSYPITTTITDSGGASTVAHSTASVAGAPSASAAFSVVSVAPGLAVFDASSSLPPGARATRFIWSIGKRQPEAVCPGSEPQLSMRTRSHLNGVVILTAIDANGGAATTTAHTVAIPPPSRSGRRASAAAVRGAGRAGRAVTPAFNTLDLCQPAGTQAGRGQARVSGGSLEPSGPPGSPPVGCSEDLEFGAVDAHGCLTPVDDLTQIGSSYAAITSLLCDKNKFFCVPSPKLLHGSKVPGSGARSSRNLPRGPLVQQVLALSHNYYSEYAVRIDGLDFAPAPGSVIVFVPALDLVVSDNATVRLAGQTIISSGRLVLYLPDAGGHLGDFSLPHSLDLIDNLPFQGSISVDILKAGAALANGDHCTFSCAAVSVHVSLPNVFTDDYGFGLSGDGVITADNPQGLQLNSLEVMIPNAKLDGIGVSNVDFRYTRANDSFHGAATVNVGVGEVGGSVDFVHGVFNGASLTFGADPGINLGGPIPIFLTQLGGGFTINPAVVSASATIAGGPKLFGCTLFSIDANLGITFDPPFSLDATGQGDVLCQHVGDEHLHFDSGGLFDVGATVDVNIAFFESRSGIDFGIDLAHGRFQYDANSDICIHLLGTHCLGGELVISDRGAGVCLDLGFTHAGGGVQFSPFNLIIFLDSCDIGKFRSMGFTTSRARATAASGFTVPRGQRVAVIGLVGNGAAPHATLRGPDGRTIPTPPDGFVKTPDEVVIRDDKQSKTTYFFINHPTPGQWSVTPDPGSAAIASIRQATTLPDPQVRATVIAGRGGSERLRYSLHPSPGQVVTFAEQIGRGARTIGAARGAHGTIRFTPAETRQRARTIVAWITQDGRPRADRIVAHYTAPGPRLLAPPRALRVRRLRGQVRLSWRAVPGAIGYVISARFTDGRRVDLTARGAHPHVTINSVPAEAAGRFQIAARTRIRVGRPARALLRAGKPPRKTVIRPNPI